MAGRKTHEQQRRQLERKPDYPDGVREDEATKRMMENATTRGDHNLDPGNGASPVRREGAHRESAHNKHTDGGRHGHAPQVHSDEEEGD